jgi:hypothetical protein
VDEVLQVVLVVAVADDGLDDVLAALLEQLPSSRARERAEPLHPLPLLLFHHPRRRTERLAARCGIVFIDVAVAVNVRLSAAAAAAAAVVAAVFAAANTHHHLRRIAVE